MFRFPCIHIFFSHDKGTVNFCGGPTPDEDALALSIQRTLEPIDPFHDTTVPSSRVGKLRTLLLKNYPRPFPVS